MKSFNGRDWDRLRVVLTAAYHRREAIEINDGWQEEVMRKVRLAGPLATGEAYLQRLQFLVWRLAPVTFVLALILGAVIVQIDFFFGYKAAQLLVENTGRYWMFGMTEINGL